MTYEEAITYLESFVNYERKTHYHYSTAFKFERIRKFLSCLGDPQDQLKIIHVAGTKGKGSASCFIAHILKEEGLRVGLYTSPHLKDLRERIRILDPNNTADEKIFFPGMILKNDFVALLESLAPKIESFHHTFSNLDKLTFFEVLTVVALMYFKDKGVDFVVLETGLGGRFDATNATNALVSVITPISYDHEQILGQTLPEIAYEKAGIIKSSNIRAADGVGVAVTANQTKEVMDVLRRRAASEGSVLFEMEKDFYFKRLSGDLMSQDFFYKGLNDGSFFFKTRMLGTHQLVNASLSLAACEALSLHGIRIRSDSMSRGLWNAFWPGRLEVIHTKPFIILDGAHNRDSASRLVNFLEKEFKKFSKWLVFGASEDKDLKGIVEQLEPMADKIILTRADNPRSADPEKTLKPYFKKSGLTVTNSVEQALEFLNREIKEEEVAIITGSLFVVGEARAIWRK
jgi:dihydrofolate synthase/folylpolyglutamate synthase